MARKSNKVKRAEIFAKDGRKILGAKDWNAAVKKRIRERALAIIKEKDEQAAGRSLGSLQITLGKLTVKASKPDYNGKIEKLLEFTATVPFSQKAENLMSSNLQEPLVCELKPKQIGMNLKLGWDKQAVIPEEFLGEAAALVSEDHDVKAALDDLCTCGHTRREHADEKWGADGEALDVNIDDVGPCVSNGECECDGFVPLAPGEKPTPATGDQEPGAVCLCGHTRNLHGGPDGVVCTIDGCECEGYEEAEE